MVGALGTVYYESSSPWEKNGLRFVGIESLVLRDVHFKAVNPRFFRSSANPRSGALPGSNQKPCLETTSLQPSNAEPQWSPSWPPIRWNVRSTGTGTARARDLAGPEVSSLNRFHGPTLGTVRCGGTGESRGARRSTRGSTTKIHHLSD